MKRSLSILLTVALLLTNCFVFTAFAAEPTTYYVEATGFCDENGDAVYTLAAGDYSAQANIFNRSGAPEEGTWEFTLIAYLTDANGILKDIEVKTKTLSNVGVNVIKTDAITVDDATGCTLSLALVDDINNIRPVINNESITTETEEETLTTFHDDFSTVPYDSNVGSSLSRYVGDVGVLYSEVTGLVFKTWTGDTKYAVQRSNDQNQVAYLEGNGNSGSWDTYIQYDGDFGGKILSFETSLNDSGNMTAKEYYEAYTPTFKYSTDGTTWAQFDIEYIDYSTVFNYIGWNGYHGRIATFVAEIPEGAEYIRLGFTGDWHNKVLSVDVSDSVNTSGMYAVSDLYSGVVLYDNFASISSNSGTGADSVAGAKFTGGKWSWVFRTGNITGASGTLYNNRYFEGWGNSWHDRGNFKYSGSFGGCALEVITYMTLSHEQTVANLSEYVEHFDMTVWANDDVDITDSVKAKKIDETADGGAWIVKYYLNEIPADTSSITLKPLGNWHHKIVSVGVYEEPTEIEETPDPDATATPEPEITATPEPTATPDPSLPTNFVDSFDTIRPAGAYVEISSTDVAQYYSSSHLYCATDGQVQGNGDGNLDAELIYNGVFNNGLITVDVGMQDSYWRDNFVPNVLGLDFDTVGWNGAYMFDPAFTDNFTIYAGASLNTLEEVEYSYVENAGKQGEVGIRVQGSLPENAKFIKIVFTGMNWVHRIYKVEVSEATGSGSEPVVVDGTDFFDTFDTVTVNGSQDVKVTSTDTECFVNANNLFCRSAGQLQGVANGYADGSILYGGEFSNSTLRTSIGVADYYYSGTVLPSLGLELNGENGVGWSAEVLYQWLQGKVRIYAGSTDTSMTSVPYTYVTSAGKTGEVAAKIQAAIPEGSKYVKVVYSNISWQCRIYDVEVVGSTTSALTTLFDNFSTIESDATAFLSTDTTGALYSHVNNLVYRTDRQPLGITVEGENNGIIEGSWSTPGGFEIGYRGNFDGRAMRISMAFNEDSYKEAVMSVRNLDTFNNVWNDYEALYEYYIVDNFNFNYGVSHSRLVGDAGIHKYDGQTVTGFVVLNLYSNEFPDAAYVEAAFKHQNGKDAFYWRQRLLSVLIDDVYAINGSTYVNDSGSFEDIFANVDPTQYTTNRISVITPAYTSNVSGETKVAVVAPGLDKIIAYNWKNDSDVKLAEETLSDQGFGGFIFNADNFEYGPNNIIIRGYKNNALYDVCELQVYNTTGIRNDVGLANAPAVPSTVTALGLTQQYGNDFTSMPTIRSPYGGATDGDLYYPVSGRLFSDWGYAPFREGTISQVDSYLKIRATVDPNGTRNSTNGSTGFVASLNESNHKGFAIKAPAYFECKFIAQNGQGAWPSFWLMNTQNGAGPNNSLELDVIEAYGAQPDSNGRYTVESDRYSCTSHNWAGGNGNNHPAQSSWNVMTNIGNGANWHQTEHRYGVLVTSTQTIYYLDGNEVLRHNNYAGADEYLFYMIDYAFGSGYTCDLSRYNDVSDMYVDWVRVYGLSNNIMPN